MIILLLLFIYFIILLHMATIHMTIGLPGSGKSTWARANAKRLNAIIINRDAIRRMIFGGAYVFDGLYEPLVKDLAIAACRRVLLADYVDLWNIILDETAINRKSREPWVTMFKADGHRVIFVHLSEQQCNLDYRMTDSRGYDRDHWDKVIQYFKTVYEPPSMDEGCDEIIEGHIVPHIIDNITLT